MMTDVTLDYRINDERSVTEKILYWIEIFIQWRV